MKTAVSIPDPIFEAAEQTARRLAVSRSALYTQAVAAFVESHRDDRVTEKLNELYATVTSHLDLALVRSQAAALPHESW